MKVSFFVRKSWLALLLLLFFAGNNFAQSGQLPFLLDIPDGEEACALLSGDHKDKYLSLFVELTMKKEEKVRLKKNAPAPQGLYLSKDDSAKGSKWAFKPADEAKQNGDYFLECMDGTGRVVAWSDVEGFFFRPLSMMDGKMKEMATWQVRFGGVNDIGETYFIIHPKKDTGKVLAVDRKANEVGVFVDKNQKETMGRASIEMAQEEPVVDAPGVEVLWKRVCKEK
ncbi:MAG: hypothetical protein KDD01_16920 [Phaeodactylibacter sp.]|nr:hypothetical protein [Phaeodactylibacter sp.]